MKAQDFESKTTPWFDIKNWYIWTKSKGVSISKGDRHNQTDGEVHYILKYGENTFDLHANYWDYRLGWQEVINWTESITEIKYYGP
jgi:hypothetical protein